MELLRLINLIFLNFGKNPQLAIGLAIAVICGFICHAMAEGKNRNSALWAILGFLFGILAVIFLAFLPHA